MVAELWDLAPEPLPPPFQKNVEVNLPPLSVPLNWLAGWGSWKIIYGLGYQDCRHSYKSTCAKFPYWFKPQREIYALFSAPHLGLFLLSAFALNFPNNSSWARSGTRTCVPSNCSSCHCLSMSHGNCFIFLGVLHFYCSAFLCVCPLICFQLYFRSLNFLLQKLILAAQNLDTSWFHLNIPRHSPLLSPRQGRTSDLLLRMKCANWLFKDPTVQGWGSIYVWGMHCWVSCTV